MIDYDTARKIGNRLFSVGYHYPDAPYQTCICNPVTPKGGAYRDEAFELPDGRIAYFLHQHLIVLKDGNRYRLSSCGWKTPTTKDRINKYVPNGWFVYQKNYKWFLQKGHSEFSKPIKFFDGMILEVRPNDCILDGFITKEVSK